jgi:hypothetical protein
VSHLSALGAVEICIAQEHLQVADEKGQLCLKQDISTRTKMKLRLVGQKTKMVMSGVASSAVV